MAQTGYTPILIYGSSTASATPSASNLTSSANGAELALNYTDGKLYYKDNTGTVQLLASKAGASGSVTSVAQTFTGGIISVAGSPITTSGTLALTVAGTSGGIPYFSSGTTWASSNVLSSNQFVFGGGAGAAPSSSATVGFAAAFTGANTFYNATGQTFAQSSTNDGIVLQGRAGGSSSYRVTFTTATLTASRTLTLPDATGTVATNGFAVAMSLILGF
jgi:hypothetical protein